MNQAEANFSEAEKHPHVNRDFRNGREGVEVNLLTGRAEGVETARKRARCSS